MPSSTGAPSAAVTSPITQVWMPRASSSAVAASTPPAGSTATKPTPMLRVRSRSARGTDPSAPTVLKTGGRGPGRAVEPGVHAGRQHPGQVGREAAAGDVREGVHVDAVGAHEVEQVGGVDAGRLEQLLAEGAAELVDVPVEGPAGVRDDPPHEGVAVGVQAAAREAEHDVTGRDALRAEHVGVLDDAGGGTGDVVLVGFEQAGVLGGLAADRGRPGPARRPRRCRTRWRRSARARPCRVAM